MVNKFNIGLRVAFLDEVGRGVISKIINSHEVLVMREDGFEEKCLMNKLIIINEEDYAESSFENINKDDSTYKKTSKPHKKNSNSWEVDLHIENIIERHDRLTNYEIVTRQLNHCRFVLEKAIKANISRVIIIHGRGEGVLKEEVLQLLKSYKVRVKDANFQKYGLGATEVYFF